MYNNINVTTLIHAPTTENFLEKHTEMGKNYIIYRIKLMDLVKRCQMQRFLLQVITNLTCQLLITFI